MLNNKSGKVLTIFLVIIAILLISLTAISLFFFNEEVKVRKEKEKMLTQSEQSIAKLKNDLEEAQKEIFVYKEKNKEFDEKLNDMSDELELEQGLREEFKLEAQSLREKVETVTKEKEKIREKMASGLIESEQRIAELEANLKEQTDLKAELEAKLAAFEGKVETLKEEISEKEEEFEQKEAALKEMADDDKFKLEMDPILVSPEDPDNIPSIELQEIIVAPADLPEGRIVTVDKDTKFIIVSLGEKNGLKEGMILSVQRGNQYLGDVRITRVQPEMAAADLIPPLTVTMVRKNDQVINTIQ